MSDFYTAAGVPATNSALSSATIRAEFASVAAGFAKVAAYTGHAGELVRINAGGTAQESISLAALIAAAGAITFGGALSGITDLTTTGNTILGNASTDTLNVGNGGIVKDASGNTAIGGTLAVTGIITASAGVSGNVTGNLTGNLTGNVTGNLTGNVTGNASTATALQTARAINGVAFDGTSAITVTAAAGTLTGATLAAGVTASSLTSVGTLTALAMSGAISGVTNLTTTGNTVLGDASTDTLNVGNGGLVKDASGNVGIGIAAPGSKLHLESGDFWVRNGSVNIGPAAAGNIQAQLSSVQADSNNGSLIISTRGSGSLTERMRIDSSGNVGIGGTSTGDRLEVVGNATLSGGGTSRRSAFFSNTGGQLYVGVESSTGGAIFTGTSAYSGIVGTNNSTALAFATNGAERVRIDTSGNVGIGMTPSTKLDVNGTARASGANSGTSFGSGEGILKINNTSNAGWLGLEFDINGSAGASIVGAGGGSNGIGSLVFGTASVAGTVTERMRITSAGVIQDGSSNELGFKGLPAASVTTGAFVAADRGKCVYATGGVTVPNSTMAAGDVVTIVNTTGSSITITASIATLRLAGSTNTGARTLANYGIATVVFSSSTLGFISGSGLS